LDQALVHQQAGRHAEAVAAYQRHLEAHPRDAGAWAHLGGELGNLGRLAEGAEACRRALALQPTQVDGLVNLGLALSRQEQYGEAEGCFRRALAQQPQDIYARLALAECQIQTNRPEEALAQLERILAAAPAHVAAFKRMAMVHHLSGNWAGLLATLDRWIAAVPNSPEQRWERGSLRMFEGRLIEGWEDFEARFQVEAQRVSLLGPFKEPRWTGEPFPGKTLLLHWEQGFGDTFMFIRFAKLAKARGGRVVAVVQPILADVIATCEGLDAVYRHGEELPPFDLQLPVMSLPWVFRTEEATIPAEVPYLGVPEVVPNREVFQRIFAIPTDRIRIGYVWAGNSGNLNDHTRSMPFDSLAPLAALPGVAWHCFQLPVPEAQPLPSVPLSPLLSSFSDTAFALSHMDLVLTVDTAVAHLAGALGLPTFLMLRYGSEWRWQMDRPDSPWYPTMRIYRQKAPGDWDSLVAQIVADLGGEEAHG
jgi:Tfp pilus assembly protein PilF